ncbi:MAG: nitrate- and nitrite sensing domain-containing protein, partial [Actinomycetota bacterium]
MGLVPLIGLLGFSARSMVSDRASADDAARTQLIMEFAVRGGNLLHETQKERGATALYMASGGTRFVEELPAQHTTTDGRRAEFETFLNEHRSDLPAGVLDMAESVQADLGDLEGRRSQVLALGIDRGEVIRWYTAMNAKVIDAVAAGGVLAEVPELRGGVAAYGALLNAKERAGIERAQLSAAFAQDEFSPGQFATVVSLVAAQTAFVDSFYELGSDEVLAYFAVRQDDPVVAQVAELEQLAIGSPEGGFGVDSTVWFDLMTQRINLLKEVEDFQAETLLLDADAANTAATASLWWSASIVALLVALTGAATWFVSGSIRRQVREFVERADEIAAGSIVVDDLDVHREDDLGRLA